MPDPKLGFWQWPHARAEERRAMGELVLKISDLTMKRL